MVANSKKKLPELSRLGWIICSNLLCKTAYPDIVCPDTYRNIRKNTAPLLASTYDSNAVGPHYRAFGFVYLLCLDSAKNAKYVAICEEERRRLVAKITRANLVLAPTDNDET